jgi:hypothetical protein
MACNSTVPKNGLKTVRTQKSASQQVPFLGTFSPFVNNALAFSEDLFGGGQSRDDARQACSLCTNINRNRVEMLRHCGGPLGGTGGPMMMRKGRGTPGE